MATRKSKTATKYTRRGTTASKTKRKTGKKAAAKKQASKTGKAASSKSTARKTRKVSAAKGRKAASPRKRGGEIPLTVLKRRSTRLSTLIKERESKAQGSLF